MSRNKVITADAAAGLVLPGDTLATTGFVGTGFPEELALALERRRQNHPSRRVSVLASVFTYARHVPFYVSRI